MFCRLREYYNSRGMIHCICSIVKSLLRRSQKQDCGRILRIGAEIGAKDLDKEIKCYDLRSLYTEWFTHIIIFSLYKNVKFNIYG